MPKAEVRLDHKTGPVVITIEGKTPEVTAYMANRIKEIFSRKAKPSSSTDDFLRQLGIMP